MFLKADIVNGMINTMIIETIVFIVSLIVVKYLLKPDKKAFIKVIFIMGFKYILVNPLMTYFRNTGYDKEPYTYWMSIANIFVAFLVIALLRLVTKETYALIMGSISVFFDIVMVFFYMLPYNFVVMYWMKSEPIFFGKGFDVNLLWKYAILLVYLITISILFSKFCKRFGDKIRNLINKVPVVAWILFLADLSVGTVGYLYNSIFYDKKIFMYYLGTISLGLLMLYGVSILIRKAMTKEVQEKNEELNKENLTMKEYYKIVNDSMENERKFRHDIDKHMNVIKEMVDEGASEEEVKDYASSIKNTYK